VQAAREAVAQIKIHGAAYEEKMQQVVEEQDSLMRDLNSAAQETVSFIGAPGSHRTPRPRA
jgi:hypothetical protein